MKTEFLSKRHSGNAPGTGSISARALKGRHKLSERTANFYRSFRAWNISVSFYRGVAAGCIICMFCNQRP